MHLQKAADAANVIAMTEDEKQRVSGLLADIDTIPDAYVDDAPELADTVGALTLATCM